jgi:hypothetical protein
MNFFCLTKLICLFTVLNLGAIPAYSQDSAKTREITINKRPLIDFSDSLRVKLNSNVVDLEGDFLVDIQGTLDENGRIDPNTVKMSTTGDPMLVDIVVSAIEAVNSSGYFQYLGSLGTESLTLVVAQDSTDFTAVIRTELLTEIRARSVRLMLETVIDASKKKKKNEPESTNAKYDLMVLNSIGVTTDNNVLEIQAKMPKKDFHEMLTYTMGEN